jgi:hypothetical protein
MFCSGCGQAIASGQSLCPQCGRPVAPPVPTVPGLDFQLQDYEGKVKALAVVWFIYAGLSLLAGFAGLAFAGEFLSGRFGPWMHRPFMQGQLPPEWLGPTLIHFLWIALVFRAALMIIAAWGLLERTQWGRIVAIIAAFFSLLKFPFGTAIGIWTLLMLLGYRNSTLYQNLQSQ